MFHTSLVRDALPTYSAAGAQIDIRTVNVNAAPTPASLNLTENQFRQLVWTLGEYMLMAMFMGWTIAIGREEEERMLDAAARARAEGGDWVKPPPMWFETGSGWLTHELEKRDVSVPVQFLTPVLEEYHIVLRNRVLQIQHIGRNLSWFRNGQDMLEWEYCDRFPLDASQPMDSLPNNHL